MSEEGVSRGRLLIVDDEVGICAIIASVAAELGYDVAEIHDGAEFRDAYADLSPDVLVLDMDLPGFSGLEILKFLKDQGCPARIFITSGLDADDLDEAMAVGVGNKLDMAGVWLKPVSIDLIEQDLSAAPKSSA